MISNMCVMGNWSSSECSWQDLVQGCGRVAVRTQLVATPVSRVRRGIAPNNPNTRIQWLVDGAGMWAAVAMCACIQPDWMVTELNVSQIHTALVHWATRARMNVKLDRDSATNSSVQTQNGDGPAWRAMNGQCKRWKANDWPLRWWLTPLAHIHFRVRTRECYTLLHALYSRWRTDRCSEENGDCKLVPLQTPAWDA